MISSNAIANWSANAATFDWFVYYSIEEQKIIAAKVFRQGNVRAYFINLPERKDIIEWEKQQLYVASWPRNCQVRTPDVQLRVINDIGVASDFMHMMVNTNMINNLTNPHPYGPNYQNNGPRPMLYLANKADLVNSGVKQ